MSSNKSPQDDAEFFRQRGFGLKLGFGKRPALLVIDIVKAFTAPERMLGANLDAQIEATNQLLDIAHRKNVAVLFSTVSYDDDNLSDGGVWVLKQRGAATLVASGDGPEFDPRLNRDPKDSVLVKKYASCFFGTDLISRLMSQSVDTLIITGCTTSGCVRATAVDAVQNGFRPMVVKEAVGDRSERAHEQSLFDLNAKYADVVCLEETIDYLSALNVTTENV